MQETMPRRFGGSIVPSLKKRPFQTQQSKTSGALSQDARRLRRLLEHQGRELRRLAGVVSSSQDAIVCVAPDGTVLTWNDGAMRIFGYEARAIVGKPVSLLIPADIMEAEAAIFRRVMHGERIEHYETMRLHSDGTAIAVSLSISAMRDSVGRIVGVSKIGRDITERKRAEQKQAVLLDYQVKIARFGQAALAQREATGLVEYAAKEVLEGLGAQAVAYVEPGAAPDELVVRAMARARQGLAGRSKIANAPGSPMFRVLASGSHCVANEAVLPFEWAHGMGRTAIVPVQGERNVRGVLCVLNSPPGAHAAEELNFLHAAASVLSAGLQRIESERRLAVMAQFDALTGLPNRALVADRLAQMLVGARRHSASLAILFMDFDDFKSVNDSLGQAAGDELLREASRRLQAAVRAADTVARFSGDEFIVLLAELARPEDAGLVAQKILDQLSTSFQLANHEVFVTASIGIAAFPADGDNADALIGAAEAAMQRAKQSGRNGYRFFTAEIDQRIRARAKIGSELRRALERNELEIAYQAKIDLQSGLICAAEALLRWNHPERGIVSPAEFIPILEDTALIIPVGEWVLRQACRDLKTWMEGGTPVPVAVNLSARHFGQRDLDARIPNLIQEAGIPPSFIEIEITESQLMQDPDHAIRVMHGLRQRGIGVALDDFGTGYSSLAYLTRFPVSAVKIDRSFVAGIERQESEAAIVRTILEMARALGFTVIAEGVENAEQLAFLRRFGCHQAQGYLFSAPLPARAFRALLLSRKGWHMTDEKARLPIAAESASGNHAFSPPRERKVNELEGLSDAEFARYLGELSGRTIRSREDVRSYIIEMSSRPAADFSSVKRWRRAKNGLLVTVLAFAVFQYYAIDVLLQIISLPQLTIFAPPVTAVL